MRKLNYIDLFSGAGGFSLGFDNKGFHNVFSLDIEPSFCATYKKNFPLHTLIEKDIQKLTQKDIAALTNNKHVDVIIGGPPCQGFSMAGDIGRRFTDDPRNHLFKEFARVVGIVRPTYFVMENVARLYTHNGGSTREEILSTFTSMGYHVDCKILNSADYGVPQMRYRAIFIGTTSSHKITFPQKMVDRYITVKEAIDEFPVLRSGQSSHVPNHSAMKHSEQMLQKMSYVSDGGNRFQIPPSLQPKTGDVRKYIKYNSDRPSVCVTGDMRKIFHYSQNRALTVRELAKLQTFPNNFIFEGASISQQQQVGNSVPPLMAEAIAHTIKKMITDDKRPSKRPAPSSIKKG